MAFTQRLKVVYSPYIVHGTKLLSVRIRLICHGTYSMAFNPMGEINKGNNNPNTIPHLYV
jgi:hypothetical protein